MGTGHLFAATSTRINTGPMTTFQSGNAGMNHTTVSLVDGWQLTRLPPGTCLSPDQLAVTAANWHNAKVPGTVAASLHTDIDAVGNYDADDCWYRLSFDAPHKAADARYHLRFDGLATLAKVWLNGSVILTSQNMFVAQRVDVTELLRTENQLTIIFLSLQTAMHEKRPRPRWKTALVDQQNLRWFRTTLLGRIPGWTPPITPVGPWGPVVLECSKCVDLASINLQTSAHGTVGRVALHAVVAVFSGQSLKGARLRLGNDIHPLTVNVEDGATIQGDLTIADVPLWWPHTHGTPRLLGWQLEVQIDDQWLCVDAGAIGFKEIYVEQVDGRVQFSINGIPMFCRGACWTTADFLTLRGAASALRRTLELARDAGLNMLRVGGTMVYESTDFYALCDELGILVWQDFMFANMDYPVQDELFRAEIENEVQHQLNRLQRHVSIAAYCGGSEIAQQAAMLGLPADEWSNDFFAESVPQHCSQWHPEIPYFPSTPWGGALPFHVGTGISHYYGVGAYRRPLEDAKTARVKFTTECLGFSNVPDMETIALLLDGKTLPPHHPRWKARQPRDNGAGWDFEDIRDHYLRLLFNSDPITLRSQDVERYYAVSRIVTGEVMRRVFSEWRNPTNACAGALVWFFKDLWPGAGWGIIDSTGRPKAAFWYLKRAWATQAIFLTDEGLDGLDVHLVNEDSEPLDTHVELEMFQAGRIATGAAQTSVRIPGRSTVTLRGDALLGYFSDSTAAYRFGPPKHDVINVRLKRSDTGALLSEDFYFPSGLDLVLQRAAVIKSDVDWQTDETVVVTLSSDVFLQAVCISCKDFAPSDNYFHLAPNQQKSIVFSMLSLGSTTFKAHFEALNLVDTVTVRAQRKIGSQFGGTK